MNTLREPVANETAKAIRQRVTFVPLTEADQSFEAAWKPSALRELERHERPFHAQPEQDQWVHDRELAFA